MSDSLWPHRLQHTRLPCPSLSFLSLLKLTSTESVIPYNHLILCRPLPLPSIFPSIRIFSSESAFCIRWPKYWSFSFSISPSSEYSRFISFRIDWFDFLAVQGTLKSLLQKKKKKESSPAQFESINSLALSLLYGPILTSIHDYWKNHSFHFYGPLLAKWCLCFLICCLAFLPRSKCLLILHVWVSVPISNLPIYPSLLIPWQTITISLFPPSMTLLLFCK